MKTKTIVRGWRLTEKSLEELDKIRDKKYGNFVTLGKYMQFVVDDHIERENKKIKNKTKK